MQQEEKGQKEREISKALIFLAVLAVVCCSCTNRHILKRNGEVIYELETPDDDIIVKLTLPDGEVIEFNSEGAPGLMRTIVEAWGLGTLKEVSEGGD